MRTERRTHHFCSTSCQVFAFALIIAAALPARAQCDLGNGHGTRPAGTVVYNTNCDVLQVCRSDDQWHALGPFTPGCGTPSGPTGCDNIGDQCDDNSYYIGQVGGNDIYATTAANESSRTWNNNTTNWTTTGFTSTTDGPGNTAGLVALSDAGSPYEAAEYCDGLSAHGYDDWYLPAWDELDLFWNGGSPVAGVQTGILDYYWSSTEYTGSNAWVQRFSDGAQPSHGKYNHHLVRCVRRTGG